MGICIKGNFLLSMAYTNCLEDTQPALKVLVIMLLLGLLFAFENITLSTYMKRIGLSHQPR